MDKTVISDTIHYSIMDPTGNITALVESSVDIADQPVVADQIMLRHPQVEQVGFVDFTDQPSLRMAGGEFCGNATISAAALYAIRSDSKTADSDYDESSPMKVRLRVSGADQPVEVILEKESGNIVEDRCKNSSYHCFKAGIHMPSARRITKQELAYHLFQEELPLALMEGISHLIIEETSPCYNLLKARQDAEEAVKKWCGELAADGLGLMFLRKEGECFRLTPLVYVPACQTVFWENSCASGSSAVGMYLAVKTKEIVDITLSEPGGLLRVTSDPFSGETWLYGSTSLIGNYRI